MPKQSFALALELAQSVQKLPSDNLAGITGTTNRGTVLQQLQKAAADVVYALRSGDSLAHTNEKVRLLEEGVGTASIVGVISTPLRDEYYRLIDEIVSAMDVEE